MDQQKPLSLALSGEEVRVLQQALNEVLNGPEAIEDGEFATRMGATRDEATALLRRLSDAW